MQTAYTPGGGMTAVHPSRWPLALVAAFALGLAAGGALGPAAARAQDPDRPVTRAELERILTGYARRGDLELAVRTELYRRQHRWRLVDLRAGQRLVPREGTMLVVRAGRLRVVDSRGGTLADLTAGRDLGPGSLLPRNHLVLVPRGDGRHLRAESDVLVLVFGDHEVPCEGCPQEGEPSAWAAPAATP